ncbi:MAG: PAS domain S-box protein [Chloroflexi bacterium]|nr:PAS domain S-box protein [Chloroflexota bacterium]
MSSKKNRIWGNIPVNFYISVGAILAGWTFLTVFSLQRALADNPLNSQTAARSLTLTHSAVWLVGVGAILFTAYLVRNKLRAVNESQAYLQQIMSSAQDAIVVVDENNLVTLWNDAAERIFGYTRQEMIGADLLRTLAPARHYETYKRAYARLRERDKPAHPVETLAAHKSGVEFPVEFSFSTAVINQKWYAIGVIRDITRQKEAERSLQENKQKYQILVKALPDLLFRINRDGVYLDCIPSATLSPILPPDELIGKQLADVLPLDAAKKRLKQIQRALDAGETQIYEYQLEIDGRLVDYEARIIPVAAEEVLTIVRDISERKKVEIRLQRSLRKEELLRHTIRLTSTAENVADALTEVCARLAEFYEVPRAAFTLFNETRTEAEVIGEYCEVGWSSSIGFKLPVTGNPSIEQLMAGKTPLAVTDAQNDPLMGPTRDIMRQQGIVSILILPIIIADEVVGSIGIDSPEPRLFTEREIEVGQQVAAQISQVLQRKQARQALQAQRDFALQVMEAMGQGLAVVEADGSFTYTNPAFSDMIGYDAAELLGKNWQILMFSETDYQAALTELEQLGKRPVSFETRLKRANNDEVWTLVTAVPRYQGGKINGLIAVMTDMTARKSIERAQEQARDEALQASRLKSEFLANMSHEIRTPLNGIIGMTSLLLDTNLTNDQQEYAETIRSSGDLLLALINDILDFSKIEAGKLEFEYQPVDIRLCVEEALDALAPKAAEKGLEIAYLIEDGVPSTIISDVTRLRQILVNLIGNGVKFTQQGEVFVKINGRRLPDQAPSGKPRFEMQFAVHDTGVGIPEDRRNRLFHSFSQADASTTRKFGGTGLGLAISKRLVELMDGKIWVESEVGVGSVFYFTIQAEAANNQRHVYLSGGQPQLAGKRLLIVDDNQTNRYILTRQTQSWRMRPVTAASGAEALDILRQGSHFDLAILDMQMPEMDGLQLAAAIRQLPAAASLPLVRLSSIGERNNDPREAYFGAHLTKPVKPSQLYNTLIGLLPKVTVTTQPHRPVNKIDAGLGQTHPLRILLAEDNVVNQKVALRILERMGYRADLAANGREALEALRRQPYDVILMDVQMPEMDGVEATRRIIEEWPEGKRPYIIAMTAHALTGDREQYLNAGMDDYVSKPVRIEELAAALRKSPARQR